MTDLVVDTLKDGVVSFFSEMNEHRRTNHLHREGIAQSLRIHEANAKGAAAYHRREVKMANDQHAREIMQARLQHEEDVDLEKRGSIRENIRDEWMILSDRAETVFIVNTIVLGTSFMMLIEGTLPDSMTLQMHTLTVAYFCALSASICLLLSSVRFAMILRFRVGTTIVDQMQKAIDLTAKRDEQFRKNMCYRKWNQPKMTMAKQVFPYTHDHAEARKKSAAGSGTLHHKDGATGPGDEQPPAFTSALHLDRPPVLEPQQKNGRDDEHAAREGHHASREEHVSAFEDLRWVESNTGFMWEHTEEKTALEYMLRWHQGKKAQEQAVQENFDSVVPQVSTADVQPLLQSGESGRLSIVSQSTHGSLDSSEPGARLDFGDQLLENGATEADGSPVEHDLDKFEREYKILLTQRQCHNVELQETLRGIRDRFCKPWDRMAQLLFFSGTFFLVCASCFLVFGRFGYRQTGIPEGALSFPAAPLAVGGFCTPIGVTLAALIYAQVPFRRFKRHFRSLDFKEERDALAITEQERKEKEQADQRTGFAEQSLDVVPEEEPEDGSEQDKSPTHDGSPFHIARVVLVSVIANFVAFVLAAVCFGPPVPLLVPGYGTDVIHVPEVAGPTVNLTMLPLAHGASWPPFWEPSGATFWMNHSSLVVVGGGLLVEVGLDRDLRPRPGAVQQLASQSMIADVCVMPGPLGDELWIASGDDKLSLLTASVNGSLQEAVLSPVLDASGLSDSHSAAKHASFGRRVLDCQSVHGAVLSSHLWLCSNEFSWPAITTAAISLAHLPSDTVLGVSTLGVASQFPTAWLLEEPDLTAALIGNRASGDSAAVFLQGITVDGIARVDNQLLLLFTVAVSDEAGVGATSPQFFALVDDLGKVKWWRKVLPAYPGPSGVDSDHYVGSQSWRAMVVDTLRRRVFVVSVGPDPKVAFMDMPADL